MSLVAEEHVETGNREGELWCSVLTKFVFPRIVGDLHDVEFEAVVTPPDGVDACDVGTLLSHRLHQLRDSGDQVG